jgi:hypothetical protein
MDFICYAADRITSGHTTEVRLWNRFESPISQNRAKETLAFDLFDLIRRRTSLLSYSQGSNYFL